MTPDFTKWAEKLLDDLASNDFSRKKRVEVLNEQLRKAYELGIFDKILEQSKEIGENDEAVS